MFDQVSKTVQKKLRKTSGYILVIFVFMLAFSLVRNVTRVKKIASKIQEVEMQVEKSKEENEEIEKRLAIVRGEEYVEKQLRDKLGLAKEGEIVIILPDDEILKKLAPDYPEEEEVLPDPNWKKWLHLFF